MKTIFKFMLPYVVDVLIDLAKKHLNDPLTKADDVWFLETRNFLKYVAAKKIKL